MEHKRNLEKEVSEDWGCGEKELKRDSGVKVVIKGG